MKKSLLLHFILQKRFLGIKDGMGRERGSEEELLSSLLFPHNHYNSIRYRTMGFCKKEKEKLYNRINLFYSISFFCCDI